MLYLRAYASAIPSAGYVLPLNIHRSCPLILAWEIPWMEEAGGLQSMRLQKSWTQLSD